MRIEQEISVSAPKEQVWQFFHDVPSVVECLPGAELIEQESDGSYRGQLSTKLGPISMTFEGKATVAFDDDASQVTISGNGVDRKGGSRGDIVVVADIGAAEAGTHVAIAADVTLSGAAARFGRTGLITDISQRMLGDFVSCVEAKLNAAPEAAATIVAAKPQSLTVLLASLWARLRRLVTPRRTRGQNSQSH